MIGDRRPVLILTAFFVASRAVFFALGVRFDAAPLADYWQYLDPRLLEDDLLHSVYHLHSQPPLFNLFLGLVLKLSPVAPEHMFHVLYLAAGLVCYLATYALMRLLAVGRPTACILSTILVIRPSFILFENWLMYDVPVTALLCLAAVWLALLVRRGSALYAHAFFATLLLLCATRSLFHLAYFGATVALLAAVASSRYRRILLRSAAVPLLLLVLLYLKNLLLFSHPGPSTWIGMNLARVATAAMSGQELARLHRQGELSETAGVPPFSPLELYGREHFSSPRYPDVPALADRIKSTGSVNYNHEAYISISRDYFGDALWIILHRPGVYFHGVAKACYNYFKPQTEISHLSANSHRLRTYVAAGNLVLYGRLPFTFDYRGTAKPVFLFSSLGIPLLMVFALFLASRGTDAALPAARNPPARLVFAFLALTVIYVAVVGNTLEVWENQRFRFYTDPFFAVLLAIAADRMLRRIPEGGQTRVPSPRSQDVAREQVTSGSR